MSTCSVFMPRLPLAPVLARPSLRSSLAIVFGCSYAMCLRFSLDVDERHGAVEADDRAVVEPGVLARTQVDPRLLGEALLFDEFRVQREERLRLAGVQAGVALVNVDRHGRVVQCGIARRE